MSEAEDVRVPDLGDFSDVDVIEVLVNAGDQIAPEDPLITLETEKATMDVPAPFAGEVVTVVVKEGDKVSTGDTVLSARRSEVAEPAAEDSPSESPAGTAAGVDDATVQQPAPPAPVPPSTPTAAPRVLPPIDEVGFTKAHASPSVRKLARELGVSLASVEGRGAKGRVTSDDVKAFVKSILTGERHTGAALPEVPVVDFASFGEVSREPLGRIKKIAGPRLHASWVNLVHVTQHDEADITELEALRQSLKGKAAKQGIKLTPLAFIIKACVAALKEFPQFNASLDLDGQHLILKKYFHVGFAADTPLGLMVPVIRNADQKDVYELAEALAVLSAKARDRKITPDEMSGGCFTISSLGGIGGTGFTPIINAPEVAILGVARSSMQPVYQDGEFVPRLMLPLSLSYDHRVIDGAEAVRFTRFVAGQLADAHGLMEAVP